MEIFFLLNPYLFILTKKDPLPICCSFFSFALSCIIHKLFITHMFYQFTIICLFQIPNNLLDIIGLHTKFCGMLVVIL